ncbi:MAG TPA: hypothetical protein PLP19_09595 [bacterium]|nr:hypothetical protein [bacterium]HPN43730.1 hypothetical protein [bacterium]
MKNIEELETIIEALPEEEFRRFRHWFLEKDWSRWDEHIEKDSTTGKLDFLVREAREAKYNNDLKKL